MYNWWFLEKILHFPKPSTYNLKGKICTTIVGLNQEPVTKTPKNNLLFSYHWGLTFLLMRANGPPAAALRVLAEFIFGLCFHFSSSNHFP
jgi:hypothetical protein